MTGEVDGRGCALSGRCVLGLLVDWCFGCDQVDLVNIVPWVAGACFGCLWIGALDVVDMADMDIMS